MDYLYLRFGMEVCLRNKSTEKYLGFDQTTQTFNANSVPPYIQISHLDKKKPKKLLSLKFKIQPKDEADRGKVISFGSKVIFVDCETGSYLATTSEKNQIKFDTLGLDEGMNNMLEKAATFTLLDEKNSRSKQSISVYDEVHLKSVFVRFLICTRNRKVDSSGQSPKTETAWNIMKGDTPYIPGWVYHRPTFSKFLNLGQIDVDPVFGKDRKQNLGSFTPNIQEMKLIQDILDVMLGFDGEYIKKTINNQFRIQPHKQRPTCNLALAELTTKILALPTTYNIIENYISTYSIQQGVVCQALCSGLREMIKEYKMMAVSLDEEVNKKGLTLQQMWYYIQPSLQLMESIVNLVKQAQKMKGGQLITCIMKLLNGTTSQQVIKTYSYLFEKCMNMYIQMVSKWIYEGIVEDKYKEFMVMEEEKDKENDWNYWEEKYVLRRDQVPTIFAKDAHLILVTGKYLNIIKNCSELETHPLQKQIQQDLLKYLKYQDFTESIMRAYDWANQKLQILIMKKYKLTEVLQSIKGYYFLGFGDLFVHFMDSAEDALNSSPKSGRLRTGPAVSVEKLQNLFQLLIRTSSANNDPYKEEVTCKLETSMIYEQIYKIKILESQKFELDVSEKPLLKKESKYVDYFNLEYNCAFPLNLIINRKNLSKYQVIFRFMFWCKFIERQLNNIWLSLQATKIVNVLSFKKANLLTQKMLNYIKNLIYYLSYEVIEHNWMIFQENLTKVKNFEDIIHYHNTFLNKCLVESLLVNNQLLQIITIDLGNSTQGFINIKKYVSMFNPENITLIQNPHESILTQRYNRRKQIQKYFKSWHEEGEFERFVFGYNENFDKSMKKLLREIHSMAGKQESHLMGLLNKLDEKRFYDRMLFDHRYE